MVNQVNTFSVVRKRIPFVSFTNREKKLVDHLSKALDQHFSMSEELAKAIGTVVVQALTENAKDEAAAAEDPFASGDDLFADDTEGDDFGLGDDDEFSLDESELPESARDSGEVEEAEGPKNAPDLSSDFAELKKTVNHSMMTFADKRYNEVKDFLTI